MSRYLILTLLTSSSILAIEPKAGKVSEDITVGTIFPMEGAQARFGQEAMAGIELALTQLKNQDPDTLKHLNFVHLDDKSSPKGAIKAAAELIEKRASLIIGSALSSSTETLISLANEKKIPLISVTQSSLPVNESPFVFRAAYAPAHQGSHLAHFASSELKKTKVAILLNPQDRYATEIAEDFAKSFRNRGGSIMKELYHVENNTPFRAEMSRILANGYDAVLFPSSNATEIEQLVAYIKSIPAKVTVFGSDRWDSADLRLKLTHNLPSSYFVSRFSSLVNEGPALEFIQAFHQKTGRAPSALAANAYDATMLVVDALKRAGTGRQKELLRSLKGTRELAGVTGPLTMASDNTLLGQAVVLQSSTEGYKLCGLISP